MHRQMKTRREAVAGMFYEADPARLQQQVDALLDGARPPLSVVAERVHEVMRAAELLGGGDSTGALYDASLQEALRR